MDMTCWISQKYCLVIYWICFLVKSVLKCLPSKHVWLWEFLVLPNLKRIFVRFVWSGYCESARVAQKYLQCLSSLYSILLFWNCDITQVLTTSVEYYHFSSLLIPDHLFTPQGYFSCRESCFLFYIHVAAFPVSSFGTCHNLGSSPLSQQVMLHDKQWAACCAACHYTHAQCKLDVVQVYYPVKLSGLEVF